MFGVFFGKVLIGILFKFCVGVWLVVKFVCILLLLILIEDVLKIVKN